MKKRVVELAVTNLMIGTMSQYLVLKVQNSVAPIPGNHMSKEEVHRLCRSPEWNVIIKSEKAG